MRNVRGWLQGGVLGLVFMAWPVPGSEAILPNLEEEIETFQEESEKSGRLSLKDKETLTRFRGSLREQMPEPGLKVGDRAPDFVLAEAFGESTRLSDYLARGPVVLSFYRGAWDPFSRLELRALAESLPAFQEYGANVIAVSPQSPEISRQQVRDEGLTFPVLSDLESEVMKAYDLYLTVPEDISTFYRDRLGVDLAAYNGQGREVFPVPGTFVIGRDGVIQAAFADADYT
ncbi:MAG TPA: peroxiredoxin family protein, partial [Gammaproteobacteria bacterium]|nr:peroxiredoxin family protein [Gammaproteobacteria bacterium]